MWIDICVVRPKAAIVCTSDCHPLHCSPTLPSLHPAVNLLTTSCSCKTDNNNDRILQMDRRLKKVSTTLHKRHKRCPDALSHTCRRRKVSELECAELVIFPVAFLQWQKQPSYIGRLLSGGLTPTTVKLGYYVPSREMKKGTF